MQQIMQFLSSKANIPGLMSQVPHFAPQLSKEFSRHKWKLISSGQHHTVALDEDGKTYAIGRKEYGRLGLGRDCEDAVQLKQIEALKDSKIIDIACGSTTSFAVSENGEL